MPAWRPWEVITYVEKPGGGAVLVDGVEQVGLLEQQPAGRGARDGVVDDDVKGLAVKVGGGDGA